MRRIKKIFVFLGIMLYFLNRKVCSYFYQENTVEWYNLNDALISLNFFVLSIMLFWESKGYLKVIMRWFMVFCFIDFHSKTVYNIDDWGIVDKYLIGQIMIFAILETYLTYIKNRKNV